MRHRMAWLATAGLVASAAGCGWMKETISPQGTAMIRTDAARTPTPDTVRGTQGNEPKKQPQAMTCVDLGQKCCEQAGDKTRDEAARRDWYHKALINYKQALDIDPKCEPALIGMGRVYKKQGEMEKALAAFDRAVKLNANSAAAWYEMGMCWGAQQKWDEQITCLAKAAKLEDANPFYTKQLGLSLARAGRFADGYPLLLKTMGPAQANYNLALMSLHIKRRDLCEGYLTAALAVDPEMAAAKELLAHLRTGGTANPPTTE
jgi:hypothetical protein